ncbi:MAG TPA: hypothetical protein VJ397_03370 [Thermoplasmata archaeon]|nr:hypothetical protein [Thermoplasmata archaeon]
MRSTYLQGKRSEKHREHPSPYLVHLVHGVKKHLVLASCGTSITYVHLERVRP